MNKHQIMQITNHLKQLDINLENKGIQKFCVSKNVFYKKCCPKFLYFIFFFFFRKIRTFGGSLYFKTWFYPLLIYNHKQNLTMFLPKGSQESNVCYSQMICTSNVSCWFDETIDPTHDFFEFFRLFFFFLWTSNFGKPHDRVLKKSFFMLIESITYIF